MVDMHLYFLLILGVVHATYGAGVIKRVGCENNPCDHQCIDTVDSYYCQCFKNWVLQPDQHTCVHERKEATESTYLGCYAENTNERDFTNRLWGRDDASIEECIHGCRAQGFGFAALQNGRECYCDKSLLRIHGSSTTCNMPCSGSPGQICGGSQANSVYRVTRDNRYLGCYFENPSSPDLPVLAWDENTPASVDECILHCSNNNYLFGGVFNGGRCTCGNDYGSYGLAGEQYCMFTQCRNGWKEQNCGGNETNAIYRVVKGEYYGALTVDVSKYATLAADLISDYPHLQGMYAQRFAMYASDVVHAPFEDQFCTDEDCYAPCGTIAKPEGIDRYNTDVVVRKFHIYLHELNAEIDPTIQPQRVWLYAETVVITQNAVFDFALSIRARQIIIGYNSNPTITFNHEGASLDLDIDSAIHRGPPSDLTFQKQSWLCARILLAREEENYKRIGWAIFDNLARERPHSPEQQYWLDGLRAMKMDYTGVMREGVRYAPFISKAGLQSRLSIYYDQIGLYEQRYNELLDDAVECNDFKNRADSLLTIWRDSMMAQASLIRELATDSLEVSQETYTRIHAEYNQSREELEVARANFEQGIQDWQDQQARRAMFGFLRDCYEIFTGVLPVDPDATIREIIETGSEVSEDVLDAWGECSENIAASVEAMEAMLALVDEMLAGIENIETVDWTQYEGIIEIVAGLHATIEEWQVLRYTGDVLLDDPVFRGISGCLEYQMAYFDACNWGEALTKSAIENAENLRRAITADALYHNKEQMDTRIQAEIDALDAECTQRDQMVITFAEQHYDVMLDSNDALVLFCQAHFYEGFQMCPENTLPKFEGDLSYLRSALNNAFLVTSGYSRRSSGNIDIDVTDNATSEVDCKDWRECPIKVFRETKEFVYNVPIDHRRFLGIDLFLVEEIQVFFTGVSSDTSATDFRLLVDNSGPFQNKRDPARESFVSRPMAGMIYQYDIDTDVVELACDLYDGNGNANSNVQHMTPYSTWHFRIDPAWTHINVDDVTQARIVFIGPFLNTLDENGQD